MSYTGTKILVAGSDGFIHDSISEAIEYRDEGEAPVLVHGDFE